MNLQHRILFPSAILILVLGSPAAQPPLGWQIGGFGTFEWLVQNSEVRKELNLTPHQRIKIGEIGRSIREQHKKELDELWHQGPEGREKIIAVLKAISDQTAKEVEKVLKPDQGVRLRQIRYQVGGLQVFSDPEVERRLNLTSDQKEKIRTFADDTRQQGRDLFQNSQGDFRGALKKVADLEKDALAKALTLLNDDQRKAWNDLTGAPFELKFTTPTGDRPSKGDREKVK